MHSSRHNATCFKYGKPRTQKCRFNFPRPTVNATISNDLGTIDIQRNHVWLNPFNPVLMSITGSNHDVNCNPSNVKALVLVGYITSCPKRMSIHSWVLAQPPLGSSGPKRSKLMIYQVNALEWEESVRYNREGTFDTLSTPALELTSAYDNGRTYARMDNG